MVFFIKVVVSGLMMEMYIGKHGQPTNTTNNRMLFDTEDEANRFIGKLTPSDIQYEVFSE